MRILILLTSILFSFSAAAIDFRIGAGASTESDDIRMFEMGFDFNSYISLNFEGHNKHNSTAGIYSGELQAGFPLTLLGIQLKPYGSLGGFYEDVNNTDAEPNDSTYGSVGGVGVRTQWKALYADLRYDRLIYENENTGNITTISVGFSF